jgi:D-alanyl-D-alanine carboxypeptidase
MATAAELVSAAVGEANGPPLAKPAALVDVNDTIKPIPVKTIKAKFTQIKTAGLGPMIVEPAGPAPVASAPKAAALSPKTAAFSAAPIAQGAALIGPTPTAAPRATASASTKPAAMPSAAAVPVVPRAPEVAAAVAKGSVAAPSARTHAGWIVQIGAFDIEREAQRQLSSAHVKAGHVLDNADPFTEVVVKGDKTFYRARFAGFQNRDEAEAVCKQLKLSDSDCMIIKN